MPCFSSLKRHFVRPFFSKGRLAFAGGLLGLISISAIAEEPVRSIGLSDAIQLAVLHNPDFRSTGYDVTAAEGAVVQASVLPNPSINIGSLGRQLKPFDGPVPGQFGINWTIPIGGKISAATSAAEALVDAAKGSREAAHRQLIFNVQTAFVTLQLQELLISFAKQDQIGFHKELDLNELRYKDGKIAFGELLKLRIQAVATDDEVREANLNVENARAELRRNVGEGVLAESFEITGELKIPPAPAMRAIDELLAKALEKRPDYLALVAQEKSSESNLKLQRRIPIPDLGVLVDYNRPQEGACWPACRSACRGKR